MEGRVRDGRKIIDLKEDRFKGVWVMGGGEGRKVKKLIENVVEKRGEEYEDREG